MKQLKNIAARLGVTLIDLLTSKKAIAAGLGALAGLLIKDPATRDHIVQLVMVYIGAQGIVDHAKAATEAKLGIDPNTAPLPIAVVGDAPVATKKP